MYGQSGGPHMKVQQEMGVQNLCNAKSESLSVKPASFFTPDQPCMDIFLNPTMYSCYLNLTKPKLQQFHNINHSFRKAFWQKGPAHWTQMH